MADKRERIGFVPLTRAAIDWIPAFAGMTEGGGGHDGPMERA